MSKLAQDVNLQQTCSGALCAASILLLVSLVADWTRRWASSGQIKLPDKQEDAAIVDALLDQDIPQDVDVWEARILRLKLTCTIVAALNVVAWSILLYKIGVNTSTVLQLWFWVSQEPSCSA